MMKKACQGFLKNLLSAGICVDILFYISYNQSMEEKLKRTLADSIRGFHLPRYKELPHVGLYLEQTVKYINHCLEPLGYVKITGSMVRNYVKQGLVANPREKHYDGDQIAYLICIAILKQVAPLEYLHRLFGRQKETYTNQVAYDYFCNELENVLYCRFDLKDTVEDIGDTNSVEKEMLRSAVTAVSHIIYIHTCMKQLYPEKSEAPGEIRAEK